MRPRKPMQSPTDALHEKSQGYLDALAWLRLGTLILSTEAIWFRASIRNMIVRELK
jgi:hypothetical protein